MFNGYCLEFLETVGRTQTLIDRYIQIPLLHKSHFINETLTNTQITPELLLIVSRSTDPSI